MWLQLAGRWNTHQTLRGKWNLLPALGIPEKNRHSQVLSDNQLLCEPNMISDEQCDFTGWVSLTVITPLLWPPFLSQPVQQLQPPALFSLQVNTGNQTKHLKSFLQHIINNRKCGCYSSTKLFCTKKVAFYLKCQPGDISVLCLRTLKLLCRHAASKQTAITI